MLAAVGGALSLLGEEYNWEQFGTMTPAEAAQAMRDMQNRWYEESCAAEPDVPTPYWDEDADVDDEEPADEQPWYGLVTDINNPELTFVENASIWVITGFLALATWEIGAAPAILFKTIAPRFALAMRRGDIGEIIRIYVDGSEAATVDTSSYAPGEVIEVDVMGDPANSLHDVLIVQRS